MSDNDRQLHLAKKERKKFEEIIEELKEEIKNLEKKNKSNDRSFERKFQEKDKEIKYLQDENEHLTAKVSAVDKYISNISKLENENKKLKLTLERITNEKNVSKQKLEDIRRENTFLEEENNRQNDEIKQLKQQMQINTDDRGVLDEEKLDLKKTIENQKLDLLGKSNALKTMRSKIDKYEMEINNLKQELEEAKGTRNSNEKLKTTHSTSNTFKSNFEIIQLEPEATKFEEDDKQSQPKESKVEVVDSHKMPSEYGEIKLRNQPLETRAKEVLKQKNSKVDSDDESKPPTDMKNRIKMFELQSQNFTKEKKEKNIVTVDFGQSPKDMKQKIQNMELQIKSNEDDNNHLLRITSFNHEALRPEVKSRSLRVRKSGL